MNKKNFCVGLGIGLLAWSFAMMALKPRKKCCAKSALGRALKALSQAADSITDSMGW